MCVVHVEVSVTSRSLVQRSPTQYGVSECDREASIMRRPWPTGGLSRHIELVVSYILNSLPTYAAKNTRKGNYHPIATVNVPIDGIFSVSERAIDYVT